MENKDILTKIGLSAEESTIYTTLLEEGPGTVSFISKHTGLHRPRIYTILPEMVSQGLISVVPKGKQKHYVAESPQKLKLLAEDIAHQFQEQLPELEALYSRRQKKPIVKFLSGRRGIIFVYEDLLTTLKRGEIFYRYSSARSQRRQDWYVPKNYREHRDQKGIERFVITNEKTSGRKKPRLERYIKVIPKKYDLWEYDITQLIYGNKVAFVDYNTETAVIIENPIIAEFQKKIFKLLFSKL
ncbi:MAG: hypothetical protein HYT27_01410 [Parcubacteria group bacterium]|nr:hypothetical protein [Parcubacteria group bacterium]